MKKQLLLLSILIFIANIIHATDAPLNVSPSNGATNQPVEIYLDWSAVTGNSGYIFQLDTMPSFDSPIFIEGNAPINSSNATVTNLYFGATYYWRAATKTAVDTSDWSTIWSFTTIDYIYNDAPLDGSIGMPVSLNIDWDAVTGNTGYIYQLDTLLSFDSPLFLQENTSISVSNADISYLYFGTTYYWKAAAKNAVDTSQWTSPWSFTTIDQIYNTSPANGSAEQNLTLNLDWDAVSGNTGYLYKIDTISSFDSPALVEGTSSINSSNIDITNLYFGQTYYWKAAAKNAVDTSLWTPTWSYTTKSTINLVLPADLATDQPVYLQLDWSSLSGATYYDVECDTSINFDSPVFTYNSTMSSYFYESELQFDATYYWRVRARNSYDTTQWSSIRSFSTIGNLSLVSPANGTTNQDVYLQLDWSSITGTGTYQVIVDTLNTFDSPISQMYETGNSYYYVNSLNYGTEYFWKARACHANDTSEWSVSRSFTTTDNINLVSPSNGSINQDVYIQLDWSSLYGSGTYQVEIDTVNTFDSPEYQINETGNSYYYQSDLLFGKTYYWRVRACHVNDTSEWSVIWSFSTRDEIFLTSPSNGATNQDVYLMLDWAYFSGCSTYDWEIDTSANFDSGLYQNGNTGNSYIYVSDLYYNTVYYWRARGVHSEDITEWSESWSFTTNNGISLTSPSNGLTGVSISPTLDYAYSEGCLGYLCEVDTSMNFNSVEYQLFESPSGTSQVSASGLLYGTEYYWRAAPRNSVDTADWSSVWSFTTAYELTDAPVLVSPADLSINIGFPSASVSWNSSTGAVTYQYQYSSDPSFASDIHSYTTSFLSGTLTGLYPYTTYYWRVRGSNANGYSPWSDVWEFTTESAVLVPPVLISPANDAEDVDTDNVVLDWNSVFGANAYVFEITEDETFVSGVVTQQVAETEKEIIGLAYGTQYFWRVKATDGAVYSDWSDVWNFTTEYDVLETPVLISPSNGSNGLDFASITLDWAIVSGASFYTYEYSQDITFTTDLTTDMLSDTEIELIDLDANSTYYWRIKAGNGVIESPWSTVWSFTTEEQIVNYTLTITIDGYGLVYVNDVEYTEPVSVPAGTELSLFADFPLPWPFQQWTGDLTGSNNPEIIVMDGDKHVTAEFIYVSIDEMETNENGISIYPNPASSFITFECKDQERISIFSSTGQVVFEMRLDSDSISHDISSYSPGLYFVEFLSGDKIYYGRFVKE